MIFLTKYVWSLQPQCNPGELLNKYLEKPVKQKTEITCGPATLRYILSVFGINESEENLKEAAQTKSPLGTEPEKMLEVLSSYGLKPKSSSPSDINDLLEKVQFGPVLLHYTDPELGPHYIVATDIVGKNLKVMDPYEGSYRQIDISEFDRNWSVPEQNSERWMSYISKSDEFLVGWLVGKVPDEVRKKVEEASKWLQENVSEKVLQSIKKIPIRVVPSEERARYTKNSIILSEETSVASVIHEVGHAIEHSNDKIRDEARRLLGDRIKGKPTVPLYEAKEGKNYEEHGIVALGAFHRLDPYMGRIYAEGGTEITSMLLSAEYQTEVSKKISEEDKELYEFIKKVKEGGFHSQ